MGFGVLLFLVVVAAISLGVYLLTRIAAERRLVEKRLSVRGDSQADARVLSMRFADLFDDQDRIRKHINKDSELALAMWQAGYRAPIERATLYGVQVLLPLATLVLTGLWVLFNGYTQTALLGGVIVIILSVLAPKRVLQARAVVRMKAIDEELSLFVQMLRILFDSGLAVEQALKVLASDAETVLPELTKEIRPILRRAEQGLDLGEELQKSSQALQHTDYTDVVVIIRQMLKQGGSARSSLSKMVELIEGRRLSGMQEKVSKLSAKMTVVMIVFFFPALVILLAGPGFISIGDSMGDM